MEENNTEKTNKKFDWKFVTVLGVSVVAIGLSIAALCKKAPAADPIGENQNVANAYQMARIFGYTGTEQEWNESINGKDGKSAYELAVEKGYTGTLENWIASLKGEAGQNGKSAYEIYKDNVPSGTTPMTETQWLASLIGANGVNGKSAYDIYKEGVPSGETPKSESEWLAGLVGSNGSNGKSAYDLYKEGVPTGTTPLSLEDWLESLNGTNGENGKTFFEGFYETFEEINEKLKDVDTTTYKTPYDRFSQIDIDFDDVLNEYNAFGNCFYYSLKDNQFVLIDINNYVLNNKLIIRNTTSSSYREGRNLPAKQVDLFKFLFSGDTLSENYSNYLTSFYTPSGFVNDYEGTGLKGNVISPTTGLDVGSLTNTFIVRYNRPSATSGQKVLIRTQKAVTTNPEHPQTTKGHIIINAPKNASYYYGDAEIFTNGSWLLDYTKLFINDVELPKE